MASRKKTVDVVVDGGVLETGSTGASAETALVPAPDPALAKEADEAKEVRAMVQAYQIVTQADMDFADECVRDVKAKLKELEAKKKKATGHLNEALKEIRSWFAPAAEFYGQAEIIWKQKIGQWKIAEDEKQRQALAAVQEAHKTGDVQGVAAAMAVAAQATVEVPRNQTVRLVWRFAVESPELVPREFCSPDDKKIAPVVEALGLAAAETIPGIRVWKDADVIVRQK